MKHEVSRG